MHSHADQLNELTAQLADSCTECRACVRQCAFLEECGTPKEAAAAVLAGREPRVSPFACSVCGLCAGVCPEKLDPGSFFLALRARMVAEGRGIFAEHRRIAGYEERGVSPLFSFWAIPPDCHTVLFPGCALPGSRPQRIVDLVRLLQKQIPSLGVVLDCCSIISHDLGREETFAQRFGSLHKGLASRGVRTVLVACPSCHQTLSAHALDLAVRTVYELLPPPKRQPPAGGQAAQRTMTVHDACSTRFVPQAHEAVRSTLAALGVTVAEMRHRGRRTFCCGEGASVPYFRADLAATWTKKRSQEAGDTTLVAYCAGCTSFLGRNRPGVHHLLDLYFEPEATLAGKMRPARGLLAYWNRWRLKRRLARLFPAASRIRSPRHAR